MRYLLTLICLMMATPLGAVDYCVSTEAELRQALNDAEIDNSDSVIRVRATTVSLNANILYQPEFEGLVVTGKLDLLGGYNAGCTERTGVTRLINDGTQRQLRFNTQFGSVALRDLVFEGVNFKFEDRGDECAAGKVFSVNRTRVLNATGEFVCICHEVRIRNSLFVNGHPNQFYPDLSLLIDEATLATLTNNTIVDGLTVLADASGFLYNNVFAQSGTDVEVIRSPLVLYNNRYDDLSLSAGASIIAQANNISSAPNLSVTFVPNAGSAMIDAGTSIVPNGLSDLDVYSVERVIGAQVDIGAAEYRPVVPPNPFIVTNTNGSGSGSLVNAVAAANAEAGFNVISFNIPGACPHRIALSAGLSIRDRVKIDGYSQPGSVRNSSDNAAWNGSPCIILDGVNNSFSGVDSHPLLGNEGMEVSGLAFERFLIGVSLIFGQEHRIVGNQFGDRVGTSGPLLRPNTDAIVVAGQGNSAIGGDGNIFANFISGSIESGVTINLSGSTNNVIVNNRIGMTKSGSSALGNQDGIRISSSNNRVEDNFIGGNTRDGVVLSGDNANNNIVQNNRIGSLVGNFGSATGNGRFGVYLLNGAYRNRIGPNNIMGRNGDSAIRVVSSAFSFNNLRGNQIARNDAIGIDLGANGVTPNDPDGTAVCNTTTGCAANGEQNFPSLSQAQFPGGVTPVGRPLQISGTLTSRRSTSIFPYVIEFYRSDSCDASGNGQGQEPLGTLSLIVDGGLCNLANDNCTASFSTFLAQDKVEIGDVITATASSPSGATSEFSACFVVQGPTLPDAIFKNGFE